MNLQCAVRSSKIRAVFRRPSVPRTASSGRKQRCSSGTAAPSAILSGTKKEQKRKEKIQQISKKEVQNKYFQVPKFLHHFLALMQVILLTPRWPLFLAIVDCSASWRRCSARLQLSNQMQCRTRKRSSPTSLKSDSTSSSGKVSVITKERAAELCADLEGTEWYESEVRGLVGGCSVLVFSKLKRRGPCGKT